MTEIPRKTKIPKRRPHFRNKRFIKQVDSKRGGVWIRPTYIRGNASTVLGRQTGYKPYMSSWLKRAYAYIKAMENFEDPKNIPGPKVPKQVIDALRLQVIDAKTVEPKSFMQWVRSKYQMETSPYQKKVMGDIVKFLLSERFRVEELLKRENMRGII